MHDGQTIRLSTIHVGDGAPRALVIHGNDLCGAFYRPLAERLAERGVSSALATLPGFHGEPPLPSPSWSAMVDVVVDALPEDATLIGHSMGGLIALLAAARRPARLRRLVLLEPAVFPSRWVALIAARRYTATVVRGDRERFDNWNGAMPRVHDLARYPRAAIELYLEGRRRGDRATGEALFGSLAALYPLPYDRIEVPTLLVTGAEIGWRGQLMRRQLVRALRPERVACPGAAHWLVHEADELVAASVARFVSS